MKWSLFLPLEVYLAPITPGSPPANAQGNSLRRKPAALVFCCCVTKYNKLTVSSNTCNYLLVSIVWLQCGWILCSGSYHRKIKMILNSQTVFVMLMTMITANTKHQALFCTFTYINSFNPMRWVQSTPFYR